jgi:hypothetical protein
MSVKDGATGTGTSKEKLRETAAATYLADDINKKAGTGRKVVRIK